MIPVLEVTPMVPSMYYFYIKSGTFSEVFLTWSSLTCNIFSKKSWFLCSDKSQVPKSGDVVACFYCDITVKPS